LQRRGDEEISKEGERKKGGGRGRGGVGGGRGTKE